MKEKIFKIIAETAEINETDITENSNLETDLGLESLDLVNLIVAFEDELGFEIPDQDIKKFQTVKDIIEYAEEHE